jgi:hypothetical protein
MTKMYLCHFREWQFQTTVLPRIHSLAAAIHDSREAFSPLQSQRQPMEEPCRVNAQIRDRPDPRLSPTGPVNLMIPGGSLRQFLWRAIGFANAGGSLLTCLRPGPGKSIISEKTRIMNKTDILAAEEAMEIALCFFRKVNRTGGPGGRIGYGKDTVDGTRQ